MSQLTNVINLVFNIYIILIIIASLATWLGPNVRYQQWFQILTAITDPVLVPIRNLMNRVTGNIGIDFSPMVAVVALNILQGIVVGMLAPYTRGY